MVGNSSVLCILARYRYLLQSIDQNGFNFFDFYKSNLDYDQNFTEKKTGNNFTNRGEKQAWALSQLSTQ